MAQSTRVHLIISGLVQGVLFRSSAQKEAQKLGLTGWAHNLLDGRVEIVCEGEEEQVKIFIEWCKRGPPLARVKNVHVERQEYKGEFASFQVREFGF